MNCEFAYFFFLFTLYARLLYFPFAYTQHRNTHKHTRIYIYIAEQLSKDEFQSDSSQSKSKQPFTIQANEIAKEKENTKKENETQNNVIHNNNNDESKSLQNTESMPKYDRYQAYRDSENQLLTNIATSEQLAKLKLKPGKNTVKVMCVFLTF